MALLAVDAGRSEVEVKSKNGVLRFPSGISEATKQDHPQYIKGDLEIEVDGKKWWVGDIVEREGNSLKVNNFGESKADPVLKVQVLASVIYSGLVGDRIDLGVLVPVDRFNKEERKKIKELLKGKHEITYSLVEESKQVPTLKTAIINIQDKIFFVPEGASAYWSDPQTEDTQTFDFGAKTINLVTHQFKDIEAVYINTKSSTVWYGWENVKYSSDYKNVPDKLLSDEEGRTLASGLARKAIDEAKKLNWSERIKTQVFGGVAHLVYPYIEQAFPRAYIPQDPRDGNVIGLYKKMEEVILNV